jgi:hypothetical protein
MKTSYIVFGASVYDVSQPGATTPAVVSAARQLFTVCACVV